jgi:hypothetical protein
MALRAALVDLGYRKVQRAEPGRKTHGMTVMTPVEDSPPFRARLTIQQAGERLDDGRVLTEPKPTLLTGKRDKSGTELSFAHNQRIRVKSKSLGEADWEVDGEPVPIRKKRRIIGWTLNLKRTEEGTRQ